MQVISQLLHINADLYVKLWLAVLRTENSVSYLHMCPFFLQLCTRHLGAYLPSSMLVRLHTFQNLQIFQT